MYLYIFDATEVSEVCYYADPIPSVELSPWRQQWDAESDTESNTDSAERHTMDNGGPREGDRHYSIDAKLKELQQTTSTRQSTLLDSGMEIGPPARPCFPEKGHHLYEVFTRRLGSVCKESRQ